MAGNPQVLGLLEEMLDAGKTPEEVCRDCPELLPEVRRAVAGVPPHRRGTSWTLLPGLRTTPGCRRGHARAARRRPAAGPRLRGGGGARPRRHGRRLQGPAARARSPGRGQDAARGPVRRSAGARALPPGDRGPRLPAAPEHRAGVRRGRRRGPAVLRHGVRRGGQPGPEAGGHAPAGPPGGRAAWPRWPRPCRWRTRRGSSTAT